MAASFAELALPNALAEPGQLPLAEPGQLPQHRAALAAFLEHWTEEASSPAALSGQLFQGLLRRAGGPEWLALAGAQRGLPAGRQQLFWQPTVGGLHGQQAGATTEALHACLNCAAQEGSDMEALPTPIPAPPPGWLPRVAHPEIKRWALHLHSTWGALGRQVGVGYKAQQPGTMRCQLKSVSSGVG